MLVLLSDLGLVYQLRDNCMEWISSQAPSSSLSTTRFFFFLKGGIFPGRADPTEVTEAAGDTADQLSFAKPCQEQEHT